MRLIDADAFIKKVVEYSHQSTKTIGIALDATPTVDAVPVAHAKWLTVHGDDRLMCSRCKWKEHVPTVMGKPTIWEYCPSCGARMDGGMNDATD